MPTISEDDQTLSAAVEIKKVLETSLSLPTNEKIKHIKILKQLAAIVNGEAPRVAGQRPPRVASQRPPKVGNPTTSKDTTDPAVIRLIYPGYTNVTHEAIHRSKK